MNFQSLEYFEMLARERNFTRAAERLHITQQSLSSNIAKMEKELGCQLIVRHVPLDLTYAGTVLLRYAEFFREERLQMSHEFCDISQNQRGILRIGIANTRGRAILPDVIMKFQETYPLIRIALMEDSNDNIHRKLLDGEVDLAIANFPNSLPGVTLRDFYREEVALFVSRKLFESLFGDEAPYRAQEFEQGNYSVIANCPLMLGSVEDIGGHIERMLLKRADIIHPRIVMTSGNLETLLAMCLRGAGACFCPELLVRSTLTTEQLDSLLVLHVGEMARYQIRFGYRTHTYQWSIIDAFIQTTINIVPGASKLKPLVS